jgi:hypothetical protein
VIDRQHVWVGPEATRFEASCDACLARREDWSVSVRAALIEGSLRRDADVGFMTCRRGHRIIIRRVGRRALGGHVLDTPLPVMPPPYAGQPLAAPRSTFGSSHTG